MSERDDTSPEHAPEGKKAASKPDKGYEVEPLVEKAGPGKAEIDAEPLTTGFDEDADFDHDPEVAAALGGKKAKKKPKVEADEDDPSLIRPGLGPWRGWAGAGIFLLLAAMVLSTLNFADDADVFRHRPLAHAMLVLYNGMLHTGTGVAALFFAAIVLEKPFGSVEYAVGRMLAAMGAFLAVFYIPINLVNAGKLEEWILASAAYALVITITFRPGRVALAIIAGAHFGLWLVVQFGMLLSQWTVPASAASGS